LRSPETETAEHPEEAEKTSFSAGLAPSALQSFGWLLRKEWRDLLASRVRLLEGFIGRGEGLAVIAVAVLEAR